MNLESRYVRRTEVRSKKYTTSILKVRARTRRDRHFKYSVGKYDIPHAHWVVRKHYARVVEARVYQIASVKLKDLNTNDLGAAKKQVAGTARSMGIKVAG